MTAHIDLRDHSVEFLMDMKDEHTSLPRRRRNRTVFTGDSITLMEEQFNKNRYPDIHQRETLAEKIGVSEARVQVWFQNRRARSNKRKLQDVDMTITDQEIEEVLKRVPVKTNKRKKSMLGTERLTSDSDQALFTSNGPRENHVAFQQQQMLMQYKHLFPYYQNPYMTFSFPAAQHPGQFDSINWKHSPSFPFAEHWSGFRGAQSESPNGEKTPKVFEENDNFVARLFRFSSPSYKEENGFAAHKKNPLQMTFPHIINSRYSMAEFHRQEDGSLDASLSRAPRLSDVRDEMDGEESSSSDNNSDNNSV